MSLINNGERRPREIVDDLAQEAKRCIALGLTDVTVKTEDIIILVNALDGVLTNKRTKRPYTRLPRKDITAIRASYASGLVSQRFLAEQYGVDQSGISRIVNYKRRAGIS